STTSLHTLSLHDALPIFREDTFAEFGAEDGDDFLSAGQLGLGTATFSSSPPAEFSTGNLKEVDAITVNKVHGNEFSIAKAIARRSEEHTSELQSRENLVC